MATTVSERPPGAIGIGAAGCVAGHGRDLAGLRLDRERLLLVRGDRGRVQLLLARQRRQVRGALRAGLLEHERRLRRLLREAEQVALLRRERPRERVAVCFACRVCSITTRSWSAIRSSESRFAERVARPRWRRARPPAGRCRPARTGAPAWRRATAPRPSACAERRGAAGVRAASSAFTSAVRIRSVDESRALAREPRVERVQLEHDAARAGREVGVLLRERRGVLARARSSSPRRRSPREPVRERAGLRGRPANSGACASPPARRGTVAHEFVRIRARIRAFGPFGSRKPFAVVRQAC